MVGLTSRVNHMCKRKRNDVGCGKLSLHDSCMSKLAMETMEKKWMEITGSSYSFSLPETNSSPLKIDGWNNYSFPIGFRSIFRDNSLVSGRLIPKSLVRLASWWFNHNLKHFSQIGSFPQVRVNSKKIIETTT